MLAAATLAGIVAAGMPPDPQLPADNYPPTAQQPDRIGPESNPPPSEELPIPPRLLPSTDGMHPEGVQPGPAVAAPPMAAALPPDGSSAPSRGSFRDRWHYFMQSHLCGFRSEFQRPPLGYFQYLHGQTEVANGTAVFMTLYHYDFVDGSDKLNLHGRDQLAKIAALLPKNFFPIVIERTPKAPALAEARRVAVLNELAHGPFPIPPQRVVIGPSLGDDLRGVEAQVFNFNVMMQDLSLGHSARGGMMGGGMMGGGMMGGGMMGGLGGGLGGMGGGLGGIGGLGGGMGGMGGMGGGLGGGLGGMGGMGGMGLGR